MSSIPLLLGLTASVAGLALTMTAATELQFQDRALQTQADGFALALAELGLVEQESLSSEFLSNSLSGLLAAQSDFGFHYSRVQATTSDGQTVDVLLCAEPKLWLLPWLSGITSPAPVCASASARAIG